LRYIVALDFARVAVDDNSGDGVPLIELSLELAWDARLILVPKAST
jgi:hypothetical protein